MFQLPAEFHFNNCKVKSAQEAKYNQFLFQNNQNNESFEIFKMFKNKP